jgi:hypothetical protein
MEQSIYNKSRLDSTDQAILKEEFADFGDMWNITTRLIKAQFKSVFLKALLLKAGTALFVAIAAVLVGNSMYSSVSPYIDITVEEEVYTLQQFDEVLTRGLETGFEGFEINDQRYNEYARNNRLLFATWALMFMILFVIIGIIFTVADVRTYQTLNNHEDTHFFAFSTHHILRIIGWILLLSIAYGLVSGTISLIFELLNNAFLDNVVSSLMRLVFFGLCGLAIFYIALEQKNSLDAATKSYHKSLPVFWQNVVRWLLLNLVIFSFITIITILAVATLSFISVALASSPSLALMISLAVGFMILTVLYLITVDILTVAFNYVSFYNIHHLHTEE